MQSKWIFCKH